MLFIAVDGGPKEALHAIARDCGSSLADVQSASVEYDTHWTHLIERAPPELLVVGTSDSDRGRRIEAAARRAARAAGINIVAIEDFPGNYSPIERGEASIVFVESAAARDIASRRLGPECPRLEVASPPRYDTYRERHAQLRAATTRRWASARATNATPKVMWAGQPETADSVRTLGAILPLLRAHGVELVFKAHPRDPGYEAGTYRELLRQAGIVFQDATTASVDDALQLAPNLVITQFSSVAIEAGFYGIPSLWVLLPEAGESRLLEKKRYVLPPLCAAGGAAAATSIESLSERFPVALRDSAFRDRLLACFDAYFQVSELAAPALISRLHQLAREGK